MPVNRLTAPAGALSNQRRATIQRELSAVLLHWEGAPDTEFFRAQAWSYLIELPADAQTTAENEAPRFLVEVTVPQGTLSERRKAGLIEEATPPYSRLLDCPRPRRYAYECWCTSSPMAPGARAAPSSATPAWWPWRRATRPMRELTYVARRTVEWREVPDPKVQSDQEAIVAPVAATSCDVDSSILAGHGFIEPPLALGHECVAHVGDAVTGVAPGNLVVVPWAINCGTCANCRDGSPSTARRCRTWPCTGRRLAATGAGPSPTSSAYRTRTPCWSRCRPASTRSPWPRPATTGPCPDAWSHPT